MNDNVSPDDRSEILLGLLTDIVSAYVGNNKISPEQLEILMEKVHSALETVSGLAAARRRILLPAIPVEESVSDDYIICLEDGKKLTMLKRYLRTHHDLTPEEYRAKWNLPPDYPMVAPNYAAKRSAFAKKIGLGKGRKQP